MSDMPERIFVDAEGKDTDWFTINHLREVNPDEVVIRYAWTEEYVRADKYAELEAKNKRLVELVKELAEDYEYRSAHGEILDRLEALQGER